MFWRELYELKPNCLAEVNETEGQASQGPLCLEGYEMARALMPGEEAPRSGQYEQVGPRGGRTGQERTVTRGEPLPPTPRPGMGYVMVDPTKK